MRDKEVVKQKFFKEISENIQSLQLLRWKSVVWL